MPNAGSTSLHIPRGPALAGRVSAAQAAQAFAMLAAALGCLQPAIDPVFLTLLSASSHIPLAAHGVIVGGTQAGSALGALAVWRFGHRMPARTFLLCAALACGCSLIGAGVTDFAATLMLRCGYGAAMGMIYPHAMSICAAQRPHSAYGGMFLLQLLLAAVVSLMLPALAAAQGPAAALALLALAPAGAGAALFMIQRGGTMQNSEARPREAPATHAPIPPAGWALAAATFCFICATMLVWSFAGALAIRAGIAESVIGNAVGLGSLVGAATAMAVMRERIYVPLPVTALLAGFTLVSPILMTGPGGNTPFLVSIILLNIGSTAMIIRCSGLATATSRDSRFRTFVACTHCLGMIAGPAAGSVLVAGFGAKGLLAGVLAVLLAGFAAVLFAAIQGVGTGTWRGVSRLETAATNSRQSA